MKKLLLILLILSAVFACKKTEFSPEGPTDVRIRNISDVLTYNNIIVSTSEYEEDIDTLASISPGAETDYVRFKKAYIKAEISLKINGETFSTGPVDYTYMNYIGQDRITYEVYISNMINKELSINLVVDEPLVLK